jgi:hypothetical protein
MQQPKEINVTNETTLPELAIPLDGAVRPIAWLCLTDEGHCIIWSMHEERVREVASERGRPVIQLYSIDAAPIAIMDTRDFLGLCAPKEEDFAALYALQGHRVALIDLGPNV